MKIGEKIKERRLALKLTQKEVAAPHMTRNMLSEIENGTAMPSTTTLLYLASRLEVSPGYLLDEQMTLFEDRFHTYSKTLYRMYREHAYADCLALAESVFNGETNSELAYLLASVCLDGAENCVQGGSVNTAISMLNKMEHYMANTDFDTAHLSARAVLCRAQAIDPLTPHYALERSDYPERCALACNEELYHYLMDDCNYHYRTDIYRTHIEAKLLMKENKFTEAIILLNKLIEIRLTEQIGVLLIYRIYSDLEICYKERKDYENAYKCAGKKHSLFASFHN